MDLAPIVARLADQVAALQKVGGAVDLGSAQDDLKAKIPAAYVIPFGDQGGPNRVVNAVRQQVAERIAIVYAVSNVRDPRGEASHGDLEPIRAAVKTALLGWTPDANVYDVFEYGSGRLLSLSNAVLWWVDEFRTRGYASAA